MSIVKWMRVLLVVPFLASCASSPAGTQGKSRHFLANYLFSGGQDQDFDGIEDALDSCADTRPQALVDESGCTLKLGAVEGLEFAPNEVDLSAEAQVILTDLVNSLKRYPGVEIAVEGHTDNRGSAAANLELSKERVLAVVRYMVTKGITPERIKPFGYGESRPRVPNATPEGRKKNRRIEINTADRLL